MSRRVYKSVRGWTLGWSFPLQNFAGHAPLRFSTNLSQSHIFFKHEGKKVERYFKMKYPLVFVFILAGTSQHPMVVVCYCAIGWRASIMSQRLLDELEKPENQDIKSSLVVYSLEGAIFKWANERKDLVDPDGNDTDLIHCFNRFSGMLVDKELRFDP